MCAFERSNLGEGYLSHLSGLRYRCQAIDRTLSLRSNNTTGISLAGQLRVAVGCSIAWMLDESAVSIQIMPTNEYSMRLRSLLSIALCNTTD